MSTCVYLLALVGLLLCGEQVCCTYFNPYSGSNVIENLQRRLNSLERQAASRSQRLADMERIVTDLARQSCITGRAAIQICPDSPFDVTLLCVQGPFLNGDPPTIVDFTINFNTPFLTTPVVTVAISGQSLLLAKNCSAVITGATPEGFTFNYTADVLLPVATEVTWFACPGALFDLNQQLPLRSRSALRYSQLGESR
ncbi:uncharacterized protein [Littorina saxatilis]|uniref:MD-2-related lipid-recognition domain-containing protein n=1 Tax=Littorina saxatilis TaxID=31220 RepID=A0AAN9GJC8_9CAEN